MNFTLQIATDLNIYFNLIIIVGPTLLAVCILYKSLYWLSVSSKLLKRTASIEFTMGPTSYISYYWSRNRTVCWPTWLGLCGELRAQTSIMKTDKVWSCEAEWIKTYYTPKKDIHTQHFEHWTLLAVEQDCGREVPRSPGRSCL